MVGLFWPCQGRRWRNQLAADIKLKMKYHSIVSIVKRIAIYKRRRRAGGICLLRDLKFVFSVSWKRSNCCHCFVYCHTQCDLGEQDRSSEEVLEFRKKEEWKVRRKWILDIMTEEWECKWLLKESQNRNEWERGQLRFLIEVLKNQTGN
jgi:hypothetical protein